MKRVMFKYLSSALLLLLVALNSCGSNENGSAAKENGVIHISADESFKPVIDSEIQVFESLHPGSHVIAHYKPEAECLKDFAVDSISLIIATRGYSKSEEAFMNDSLKVDVSKMVVAYDAVAVIVNPNAVDTLFTMQEIKDLLTGKSAKKWQPVFDGLNATSTVRFVIDSVLRGEKLSAGVQAAESSEGVIDYVAKNSKAVGFIGVSWVGNRQDSTQLSYLQRIKVASIEHPVIPGKYVIPAQFNIYYRRYPMVRDLVYTLKEKQVGVAHSFANFLTTQSGQLIFNRAFLMPAVMGFKIRGATLSE